MPTNVTIFVPAFGRQISTTTVESLTALYSALMHRGMDYTFASFSWPDIDEARNCALTWWHDMVPDSSHLLMVDADMGFSPDMVMDMLMFGEPVVGAIYPKKTLPIEWVASGIEAPEVRKGFIEVEGLGGGCLLIRRDAIAPMIEKYPELLYDYVSVPETKFAGTTRTFGFFDCMRTEKGKVSEDIAFCRRVRAAGGRVWGCIGHVVEHVGPWSFSGSLQQWRAQQKAGQIQQAAVQVNMERIDQMNVDLLNRGAISLEEAQQIVPMLGAPATHNLRNAIAERMGAPTFENKIYPETRVGGLNGQSPA